MCAEPGDKLQLIVQVALRANANGSKIGISFNPTASRKLPFPAGSLQSTPFKTRALNFKFDANSVNEGCNRVVVMNCGIEAVDVVAVELRFHTR
jgi:hypothetical protein